MRSGVERGDRLAVGRAADEGGALGQRNPVEPLLLHAIADDGQAERQRRLDVEAEIDGDDALRLVGHVVGAGRGGDAVRIGGARRAEAGKAGGERTEAEAAAGKADAHGDLLSDVAAPGPSWKALRVA